ncbi:hypothetical protein V5O48_016003 [Marasmius crinis-equi]|uniref:Uncharacterized protein n=1 Tax=Marasmius crinis-equi TaxID=585013 RepID=A0ABR3ET12_9AGAR
MKFLALAATLATVAVSSVSAVCPGSAFGIIKASDGYRVVNNDCRELWPDTPVTGNPCTSGRFGCSPAPIKITDLYVYNPNKGLTEHYVCGGGGGSCPGIGNIERCCK